MPHDRDEQRQRQQKPEATEPGAGERALHTDTLRDLEAPDGSAEAVRAGAPKVPDPTAPLG